MARKVWSTWSPRRVAAASCPLAPNVVGRITPPVMMTVVRGLPTSSMAFVTAVVTTTRSCLPCSARARHRVVVPESRMIELPSWHELRGPAADGHLLVGVLAQAERRVGLVAGTQRDGAAVGPPHEALIRESGEVATDGLIGHAQDLDKVPTPHAAALPDQVGDQLQAVCGEHLLAHGPLLRDGR